MAFCLVFLLSVSFFSNGFAQSSEPNTCDGSNEAICGSPVSGNLAEMIGHADIHDSCRPEGACPWIQGVDIWWPGNPSSTVRPTDLLSVLNGKVVTAGHIDGAGNPVIAIRNQYYLCYYLHADAIYVSVGQDITIGTPLGLMGLQGRASQITHVHFSCKRNSTGDRGISLRLNELAPLLTGWSELSGMNPADFTGTTSTTSAGESNQDITIDDLPYAMANDVAFLMPYTPTPEITVIATETQASVQDQIVAIEATVVPFQTQTPELTSAPKTNIFIFVLVILFLAWFIAPKDDGGRRNQLE